MLNDLKKISVKNILIKNKFLPILYEKSLIKEALEKMNERKYGVCFCISQKKHLIGIITDGDLRRKTLSAQKPAGAFLSDYLVSHINQNPIKININESIYHALKLMENSKIWDLPVINKNNKLCGMLHFHSLINLIVKK